LSDVLATFGGIVAMCAVIVALAAPLLVTVLQGALEKRLRQRTLDVITRARGADREADVNVSLSSE